MATPGNDILGTMKSTALLAAGLPLVMKDRPASR